MFINYIQNKKGVDEEEAPYKRASVDVVVFGERKSKVVYMPMFHLWQNNNKKKTKNIQVIIQTVIKTDMIDQL